MLAASLAFLEARGPSWLGTNSDPSYAYLLNGLRLAEGRAPLHLDHPGLTVHLLGAGVVRLLHAGDPAPVADAVLADPERDARAIVRTMIALNALASLLAGAVVLAVTARAPLAWLVQATPLFSPSCFSELTDLKPEPLLYLLASLVAGALLALVARGHAGREWLVPALGALVGIAVATKFTAVALGVLLLVAVEGRRARLRGLGAAAAAFALSTAPAWVEWRRAAAFVSRVALGSGLYGRGAAAEPGSYAAALRQALVEEAPFFAVLAVGIVAALVAHRRRSANPPPARSRAQRALWGLLACGGVQAMLLLRHPYQPRYLLPALGLTGATLALAAWLGCWRDDGSVDARARAGAVALCIAVAILQAPRFVRRLAQTREATADQLAARRTAEALAGRCALVSYYRVSSPSFALHQGDSVAGFAYSARLAAMRPPELFLFPGGGLHGFAGPASAAEWSGRECVVFQGSPAGPDRPLAAGPLARETIPLDGELTARFVSGWEAVYEVRRAQASDSTASPLRIGSRP